MHHHKGNTLEWEVTDKKEICKTKVMTLTEIKAYSPEKTSGSFIVMDAPDWVITVPSYTADDEDYFLMVQQWRHGTQSVSIEFPGGVINPGEKPEDAAARELLEETGYKAQKITHLGSVSPNPAIMSNTVHFYAAEHLINTHSQHLDDDEYVDCLVIPQETVMQNMGRHPYIHGLMCAALDMFRRFRPQ